MKILFLRITAFLLLAAGGLFLADGCWIKTMAVVAQILLRYAWEETMKTGERVKPWPWADTWPVARLRMDRLAVDLIVLEGAHGEVLAFGPGHLPESSLPGSEGHCILAGHRDTSFRFLQFLHPGDLFTLQTAAEVTRQYRIRKSIVHEAENLYLRESDSARVTLLTCYPFDTIQSGTALRYIVSADMVSWPGEVLLKSVDGS